MSVGPGGVADISDTSNEKVLGFDSISIVRFSLP
jgi:hypothetical protein